MKDDENAPRGRETMLPDLLAARADAASVLVVDDAEANARVFAEMVRDAGFEPTVATSVNDALAALATTPRGFAAAVLDLALDVPAARLHETLVRLDVPVVLVSGVEAEHLPDVAHARGWRYLGKPVEPAALASALEQVTADRSPPTRRTRTPPKATPRADEVVAPRHETPPDGVRVPASLQPTTPPTSWPAAFDGAVDRLTRRGLRAAVAWWIFKLQLVGRVSPEVLLAMAVCAVGIEAAVHAARERKAAAAAAVLIPAVLGGAGELLGIDWLTRAGVLVTALGLPFAGWFASPQR